MGAIKITKVIDYMGDYYIVSGDGKSWYGWNLAFSGLGGLFDLRYVISMATRHIVQSSLKMRAGV